MSYETDCFSTNVSDEAGLYLQCLSLNIQIWRDFPGGWTEQEMWRHF